ncbi:MAG: GAF domain-containing protein [Vicinamibacterales bacterium]
MENLSEALTVVADIDAVPTILEVVCRTTGLGFAAVARVTESRWVACAVRDEIAFGVRPGGELQVETTICNEIRQSGRLVAIDDVTQDDRFSRHETPRRYGFQSYISVPITWHDGRVFGTLCALDPRPARVNTPQIIGMFRLFAELIALHLEAHERVCAIEAEVVKRTAALDDANLDLRRRVAASNAERQALHALTDRLECAREQERATIARDLHGELGQALLTLKADLGAARGAIDSGSLIGRRTLELIERIDEVVESALDGPDRIAPDCPPAVLDGLGCAAAAEWLVAQFEKHTALRTQFDGDSGIDTGRGLSVATASVGTLSTREFEVLRLMAAGRSPTGIGADLGISVKTVSTYRKRILTKLALHSTAGLIRYAVEAKLLDD